MLKNLLISVVACSLLASCAPPFFPRSHHHSPKPYVAPATKPEPYVKPVSVCQQKYQVYESGHFELRVENQITVPIHRAKQRKMYYDCQGQLYRDKVETVVAPHKDIKLKPSYQMGTVKAVKLFNLESCADSSADLGVSSSVFNSLIPLNPITGLKDGLITLKGDESPGFFRFLLNKGLNRIYYTYFEECSNAEIVSSSSPIVEVCERAGKTYSGIFNVYVDYTEELLPGIQEIRADKETCEKNKNVQP